MKGMVFETMEVWVQILTFPFFSTVIMGKLLYVSLSQPHQLQKKDNDT